MNITPKAQERSNRIKKAFARHIKYSKAEKKQVFDTFFALLDAKGINVGYRSDEYEKYLQGAQSIVVGVIINMIAKNDGKPIRYNGHIFKVVLDDDGIKNLTAGLDA